MPPGETNPAAKGVGALIHRGQNAYDANGHPSGSDDHKDPGALTAIAAIVTISEIPLVSMIGTIAIPIRIRRPNDTRPWPNINDRRRSAEDARGADDEPEKDVVPVINIGKGCRRDQ